MRVILDEDVPEGLTSYLPGHDVTTVQDAGWASVKNGKLLQLVEDAEFQVFITCDKAIEHQQDFSGRPFATFLLSTNHWPSMKLHVAVITSALDQVELGTVDRIPYGRFIQRRFRNQQGPVL